MKASERLAERNDIVTVLMQIDSELPTAGEKFSELLSIRAGLCRELNNLGFIAPELDV